MNSKPLILWDVDGTLLDTGGAGVEPFHASMERHLKKDLNFDRVKLAGKTDFEIIEIVSGLSISNPFNYRKYQRILGSYTKGLSLNLEYKPVKVFKEIEKTLQALEECNIDFGVLSGNCSNGGQVKLKNGKLDEYFKKNLCFFSTFRLNTRIKILGDVLSQHSRIILVGDTPNDVIAAKRYNIPVISVATGFFEMSELQKLNMGNVLSENWTTNNFIDLLYSILKS